MNFRLPLLPVGGRGESGYTMMLPIQRQWRVKFPQAGRALSVATAKGPEALANAARSTGQLYKANVPQALLEQLEGAGLAIRSSTQMAGSNALE